MKYIFLAALAFSQFSCNSSDTGLSPKKELQKQQTPLLTNIDSIPVLTDWKADFSFEADGKGEVVLPEK
jgi:hypothetical protein